MKYTLWALLALILVGGVYRLSTADPVSTLVLTNQTDKVIQRLYVSQSKAIFHGANQIEEELLRPGQSLEVRVRRCNIAYDIRADFVEKTASLETRIEITACGDRTLVPLHSAPEKRTSNAG